MKVLMFHHQDERIELHYNDTPCCRWEIEGVEKLKSVKSIIYFLKTGIWAVQGKYAIYHADTSKFNLDNLVLKDWKNK